jgi:hypothetical protein
VGVELHCRHHMERYRQVDLMNELVENYEYMQLHMEHSKIRSVGAYSVTSVTGPSAHGGLLQTWRFFSYRFLQIF